jgi:hypothetical protein
VTNLTSSSSADALVICNSNEDHVAPSDTRDITIGKVFGGCLLAGPNIESLTLGHVQSSNISKMAVFVYAAIKKLHIKSGYGNNSFSTQHLVYVSGGASIDLLIVDGVEWTAGAATQIVIVQPTATVDTVRIGMTKNVGGGAVIVTNATAVVNRVFLSGVNSGAGRVGDFATTTEVHLDGVASPTYGIYVRAAGVLTIYGSGINTPAISGVAGGTVTSKTSDFAVDLALAAPTVLKHNGDRAYNTNSALSCGAGPVISDGTNWKNLYTGATY